MSTCVISFSARENGNCAKISDLVGGMVRNSRVYHFSDFAIIPCGRCDYECFAARDQCPWMGDMVYELLDAVTHSTCTFFVIPNYCDYPCANFFIFNERSQCYFQHRPDLLDRYLRVPKRAIVVTNTNEENFRSALRYHAEGDMPALFLSAKRFGKVSISGDLLDSAQAVDTVEQFVREHAAQ